MANEMKIEFPDSWELVTVYDISKNIQYGYTAKSTFEQTGPRFLRITDIQDNKVNWDSVPYCIINGDEKHKYLLNEGDLVFARTGATVGKSYLIKGNIPESIFASYLIRIVFFDKIDHNYVNYFFKSQYYWEQIQEGKVGIGQPNVNGKRLSQISLPLPPTYEQNFIVEKFEELFSELDNGIENLKKAREQLKTYRQAVLKYAFEGKLTKEWRTLQRRAGNPPESAGKLLERIRKEREKHYQKQLEDWKNACKLAKTESKKKPIKPRKPKELPLLTDKELAELPELPKQWSFAKLGEISKKITDGEHFRPKTMGNGIYFLSAKDVMDNGISFDDPLYISEEDAQKARHRCNPEKGDILVVSRGATVGRLCTVNTDKIFCLLGSVILIKVCDRIESNYLSYIMKSSMIQKYLLGLCGSTAQQAIYLRDIINIPIPVLSQHEQHQIVQEIESRLSVCDKLEQTIEDSLIKAEALRQSILKKAFEGELTKDWREKNPELITGENSAEKLLEKIKAEKALAACRKKPRSKKMKKKKK